MKKTFLLTLISILSIAGLNARTKPVPSEAPDKEKVIGMPVPDIHRIGSQLPKAVLYSMNGDWSQYVPVTLSPDGQSLISFPSPSDVTDLQTPVSVGDGLWLDRRGINRNTAFTKWTYAEYAALKEVPSPTEILANIIPGARVTEILTLPMTASDASSNPEAVRRLVAEGLRNAVITYRLPGSHSTTVKPLPIPAKTTDNGNDASETEYGEPGPRPTLLTE